MANNAFQQIVAVTGMNLRNLPQRATSSVVALIGIAGVVMVLIGVLSISEGFRAVLDQSGAEDVAIVLRNGATDEMGSGLGQTQTRIIADAKGVARDATGPITSAELYVIVDIPSKRTNTPANVPLRGVSPRAAELRRGFDIVQGRNLTPGTFEIVVGRGAANQFAGLNVGNKLRIGTTDWTVVGLFQDNGSVAESELWTDATVLQGVYNRGASYQSMRVKLTSAQALQSFKDELTKDPRLNVKVQTEKEYFAEQSKTMTSLIDTIGVAIAALMGLGAVFAALNTMYSAVSTRTREIATLRALGFSTAPVIVSVLVEALLIGLIGGIGGGIISWFAFNGVQASTMNWASFSQITFAFTVTPALLVQGVIWSLVLGFFGGLLPSLRAAKLPITTGLREL